MNHKHFFLLGSSLLVAACASSDGAGDDLSTSDEALSTRRTIESASNAMVLGTSADGRYVVYGVECGGIGPAQPSAATAIKLLDTTTGHKEVLEKGFGCAPQTVTFSPNGQVVAFGDGMGQLRVHSVATHVTKPVVPAGSSPIGLSFSPDSSWFVVGSMGPSGTSLEAWEPNLTAHVKIADGAFMNPFGPAAQSVQFSPDGTRLLYLGGLTSQLPVGNLAIWSHATATSQVLATGVAAPNFVINDDWSLVAYVQGTTTPPGGGSPGAPPGQMPGAPITGELVVRNLQYGDARTIEQNTWVMPLAFAGDTLLYTATAGGPPVPGATLKAHDYSDAATVVVDTEVFASVGPGVAVSISPSGDRIAYTRNFDDMKFAGELRVASGPHFSNAQTVASDVVAVQAYGWLAGGSTLAYLHDPASTMPGSSVGTLSAWDAAKGTSVTIGTNVTQIGLRFGGTANELLFVSSYDAGKAAGDLEAWNATTGAKRTLGTDAAVITVQRSADGAFAGFLALRKSPPNTPPKTKLVVSHVTGPKRTTTIASDVTTLGMGVGGTVVYATAQGVYSARAR